MRRVWRVTATFADERVLVRHFLTKHRAKAAAKRYSEEHTEEVWDYEMHDERHYPAAISVVIEESEPVVFS